jgi:hypothetical protein
VALGLLNDLLPAAPGAEQEGAALAADFRV